ncbi:hypothetical protein NMY22_g16919 [Coprinellus aureogranulatus]|nr:hypothetical protein NMY22_g16919 [Coprinellus aureogranulatus]
MELFPESMMRGTMESRWLERSGGKIAFRRLNLNNNDFLAPALILPVFQHLLRMASGDFGHDDPSSLNGQEFFDTQGTSSHEEASSPLQTVPLPGHTSSNKEEKLPPPTLEQVVNALNPATNPHMSLKERILRLVFENNGDPDYSERALKLVQLVLWFSLRIRNSDRNVGLPTSSPATDVANNQPDSAASVGQTTATSEGTSKPRIEDPLPQDAHVEVTSISEDDNREEASTRAQPDHAENTPSILPSQRFRICGPAPYFSQRADRTNEHLKKAWFTLNDNELAQLGKEFPLELSYAYAVQDPRPASQTPYMIDQAKFLKGQAAAGRITGDGTRGSNTKEFSEQWKARGRDEHFKKKREAEATATAQLEARLSTPATKMTQGMENVKSFAPMTQKKNAALRLAFEVGGRQLESEEDDEVRQFLRAIIDKATRKLDQSDKDAAARKKRKGGNTSSEPQNAGDTTSGGSAEASSSGSRVESTSRHLPEPVNAVAEVTAGRGRKRKAGIEKAPPAARRTRLTRRVASGQKENPMVHPVISGGAGSNLNLHHHPRQHDQTDGRHTTASTTHRSSFGHVLPYGNIPNVAGASMQYTQADPSTYTAHPSIQANTRRSTGYYTPPTYSAAHYRPQPIAGPSSQPQQRMTYPRALPQAPSIPFLGAGYPSMPANTAQGTGYHAPLPHAAAHPAPQPIAGPSSQAIGWQRAAYPTPSPRTPSMAVPGMSGNASYPFTFRAPGPSFPSTDAHVSSGSTQLINFPASYSNTPAISPMVMGSGNDFDFDFTSQAGVSLTGNMGGPQTSATTDSPLLLQPGGIASNRVSTFAQVQPQTPSAPFDSLGDLEFGYMADLPY